MPKVESKVIVPLDLPTAFALSQTSGEIRKLWDPFIKEQYWLDGAVAPAKGVKTFTKSRHGFKMISQYVSIKPPKLVGMKMVEGPWFFKSFGGGWIFKDVDGSTEAIWRYTFTVKPKFLRIVANPIGVRLLRKDIDKRISFYRDACENKEVISAAKKLAELLSEANRH